jgi:hypothetical protein
MKVGEILQAWAVRAWINVHLSNLSTRPGSHVDLLEPTISFPDVMRSYLSCCVAEGSCFHLRVRFYGKDSVAVTTTKGTAPPEN